MAVLNHGAGAIHTLPKSHIEAVLTVSPLKVTEPRRVRKVLVSDPNMNFETFNGCYQIVLYYGKLNDEDCGWFLAGWTVESLARALSEHPLLAGRLHRKEGGDTGLEIVSNDSGIRLVEARIPITLSEFLELPEKDDLEAELVFWKEIDQKSPEFSPLFYVQVTNFECGGYSIGISCSLLVAETLVVENFLKKWAEIHSQILPKNAETNTPIFYHPRLKNPESPPADIICRIPTKNGAQSMVYKFAADGAKFNKELCGALAMLCVEEAGQKSDGKLGSEFSVCVEESSEVVKVENCTRIKISMQLLSLKNKITCSTWDDFGEYEVALHEGNKPVLVSRWVGSVSDGHVMVVPSPMEGVSAVIIVTLPSEKSSLNSF